MRKCVLILVLIAISATMVACGGGGNGGDEKQDLTVALSPKTASVAGGATQDFRATILNPNNSGVTWFLSGSGCTGSDCGSLGNLGGNNNQGWTATYTAPLTAPSPATVTLRATSKDDNTKSDAATITITAPVVTVSVTPATPSVILGATQQFTATVHGAANTAVTWSVSGPGTIDANGLYSAPASHSTPATVTVTATSQADNTKSGSATITIPAVSVAISPTTASETLGSTWQFTATVTNAVNTAVTWSVTGPGSESNAGLYTAPAVYTTPATATVTATSVADPSKSASATVNIPPVSVSVSPATTMVAITGKKQFTATVTGALITSVTWSVTGSGCSGSACGTIGSTGCYVAPAVVPSSSVTVRATSVADPTKSGTATVQIMPNGNFKLNGYYAMYFQAFDPTGNMLAIAGSVRADGNGNLGSGVYDQNGVSITDHSPHAISSGTYLVGPDNRGVLTWNNEVFRFAISDSGDRGYFIKFDTSGIRGSGIFKKQTTTDFSLAKFSGDYAFGFTGSGSTGERQGVVGRFTMNSSGALSQGAFDSVMAQEGHSRVDSFTGTAVMGASTFGPSNGRGSLTLTIPGLITMHGVFYMVSASEIFYISLDPVNLSAPLLSGTILTQSPPPFMVTNLNGPAVFHATGLHASMGCNAIMIGQWVATPNSNTGMGTLTAEYAGNDCGTSEPLGNFTATYSIAINGRANLDPSSGAPYFYFYMVGPNKAFMVSDDFNVMTGMFEPQTIPTGGFTNNSMMGDYFLGTIDRASAQVIDSSGVENLDGVNTWTSMEDASLPSGNYGDLSGTGSYSISAATGRGTITVPGGNGIVFYVVSPGKFYNFVLDTPDRIAESEQQ